MRRVADWLGEDRQTTISLFVGLIVLVAGVTLLGDGYDMSGSVLTLVGFLVLLNGFRGWG